MRRRTPCSFCRPRRTSGLTAGSPAIDAARAEVSGWPSTDVRRSGALRRSSPPLNTGAGIPAYADRGAYEYRPAGSRPVASLQLTPTRGMAPLTVQADASLSSDPDGPIVAYSFDFGDGTVVGPQSSPIANHVFAPAASGR